MIAQTIQLALAPVFVLVALGHLFVTLSARLSRVADRARELQASYRESTGAAHEMVVRQIQETDKRIALIGRSLRAMVISALGIGLTVAILFLEDWFEVEVEGFVGAVFLFSLIWMMWGLLLFLRETRIAQRSLSIPRDYFEARPDE
jgi:uncharacterized membrane protein (DUF106 family)